MMALREPAGGTARGPDRGRGPGRRAGRRKTAVLEAACRVIADRGADATRFADVAAESGVPVSTLQYYFGSREDLLVAALRRLVADVVRRGVELGRFGSVQPDKVAVLAIALVDGMGIPLSLADPEITAPSAAQDVLAALREILRP